MSKTKITPLFGTSNIIHSDVWRVQSLRQKPKCPPPPISIALTNTRETNKRKHIILSLLIAVATILMVACPPEPTKNKGSTSLQALMIKQLLGSLAKAVDMPEKTKEEKTKKQTVIRSLLKEIKETDTAYKHKPTTKDELVTLIKAETWKQGTSGNQNWNANLNDIDTSQTTDMSYLFSNDTKNGYGLDEYIGLPPMWTLSKPTKAVDMYKGSKAPLPTWHSIAKLEAEVTKKSPKQAAIKALIKNITKDNLNYKHKPKNKGELALLIKAETWKQGTGGNQDWEANLNNIDISLIADMSRLFSSFHGYGLSKYNGNIGKWNVSRVTDMNNMFNGARSFNQDIGAWDVSSVTNMNSMFVSARSFDQDISAWKVSSVTDMHSMFFSASSFDQDLDNWDRHLKKADGTSYRKIIVDNMFFGSKRENNPPTWLSGLAKIPKP